MSEQNSLIIFTEAAKMLAAADTIQKVREFQNAAITAAEWAKRKGMGEEVIKTAKSYALRAEIKMGQMLKEKPPAYKSGPGRTIKLKGGATKVLPFNLSLNELGISKKESVRAQALATLPKEEQEKVISTELTPSQAIYSKKKAQIKQRLQDIATKETIMPTGLFDVIVIDPPWELAHDPRPDYSPDNVGLEYPTMTIQQIKELKIPAATDCHIFLWAVNSHLHEAFHILESWNVKFDICFVWHKNGGYQVFGKPQMNCEFCLYGKIGSPKFFDTKAFFSCFSANRTGHSEKPAEFYSTIKRTTEGRRLDMFNRRPIDGFSVWGKETK